MQAIVQLSRVERSGIGPETTVFGTRIEPPPYAPIRVQAAPSGHAPRTRLPARDAPWWWTQPLAPPLL
jgi:hypothetical protein